MSINGDDHDDTVVEIQDVFDDTAHQGCYLFEPSRKATEAPVERPAKRRKTNKSITFPSLFGGKEDSTSAQTRSDLFHELWSSQERAIDNVVRHVDAGVLANIVDFVKQTSADEENRRIPTGLVLTGPNYSIQRRLLEYWKANQLSQGAEEVITLDSSQTPNLITALKNVVRSVIVQRRGLDWYQSFLQEHKKRIPMNYDLELLQIFIEQEGMTKIVISILDVEVFDMSSLSDLISTLSSWVDRLPIVLLLGIATTTELFEARLPQKVVKLLWATVFDISPQEDSVYEVYQIAEDDPSTKLWLGPTLSNMLLERSKDQDESPEGFASSIRYVYMSHFFANPLSVLLAGSRSNRVLATQDLCNAIRNTDSFQRYAENLLEAKEAAAVKKLLDDDEHLINRAMAAIKDGQQAIVAFREAIRFFIRVYYSLPAPTSATLMPFEIDSQVFSGTTFLDGTLYNETLASVGDLPSDALEKLLTQCPLPNSAAVDFSTATALSKLQALHEANSGNPICNAHDPKHTTTSTTISRNNTVSLTKHAAKLSKHEKDYTLLVQDVHRAINDYFESRIIDVNKLFMNEAFVYDLKMPLAGAFTPRPRYAIERALSRPGDYLGCECCGSDGQLAEGQRSNNKLPPTSLLWQLWCEAGGIVNVRDLWEAFSSAIVEREDGGELEEGAAGDELRPRDGLSPSVDERTALALFYRSLAELQMLGFVKATKKKVDCLAKAAWRGL